MGAQRPGGSNPPLSASQLFLLRNPLRPKAPCSRAQGDSNPQGREAAETRERFPASARGPQARSGARAAEPAAEPPHHPSRITKTCRLESHQVRSLRPHSPHRASLADPLRACPRPLACGLALRVVPPLRRGGNVITAPTDRTGRREGRGVPPAGCCRPPVEAQPKTATVSHPLAEPGKANLSRSDPGAARPSRRNRSRVVPKHETPTRNTFRLKTSTRMKASSKFAGLLAANRICVEVWSRNVDTERISRENFNTNRRSLTKPQVSSAEIDFVSRFGAETST